MLKKKETKTMHLAKVAGLYIVIAAIYWGVASLLINEYNPLKWTVQHKLNYLMGLAVFLFAFYVGYKSK